VPDFINHIDHSLFLFLNGLHSPFFDNLVFQATKPLPWLPLYLLFLYLVIRQYKWKTLIIIVIAALMILVSDQLANLFKAMTMRLRPSNEPGLMVHIVNAYKGGVYGFYSSHASNTFAIAFFLIMILGKRYRWIWIATIPWALLMSYTRIYLGVHFPGDIIVGSIAGCILGVLFGKVALKILANRKLSFFHHSRHNRSQ
jgi:undecaprenyl-diphosphatase